jgi:hypothetical protein
VLVSLRTIARQGRSGASPIEIADRVRRWCYRMLGPRSRLLVLPRARRIAVVSTLGVAAALLLTLAAPLGVLALGPLLLGVPHLLADARYLVVRPRLYRRAEVWMAGALLAVGLACGFGVRAGFAAAALVALGPGASLRRRGLVAAASLGLLALAQCAPARADIVFFQSHNLVALGLWLAWRPRTSRAYLVPLLGFFSASLFVWLGPSQGALSLEPAHWSGLSFAELGATLSFSLQPESAVRAVRFFAFAQSVHYLVWLRLIPEEDRPQETPRSYRQSLRALRRDFGGVAVWAGFLVAAGLALFAMVRLALAREVYFAVAYAHGHIELLAIAWFASRGVRPRLLAARPSTCP